MKASIKAKFSIADIKKALEQVNANFDQAIIERLSFVGEKFVINARNNGAYTDRTGNLRSSIKYFIMKDGKIINGEFNDEVKPALTKKNNLAKDQPVNLERNVVAEIAERFPKGYVLVGMAGMNYAAYVESKNYDVITASAITAENDLRKSLDELRKKLSGKK